jgi:hypothetical protein
MQVQRRYILSATNAGAAIFICLAIFLLARSSKKSEPTPRIVEAPAQTLSGSDKAPSETFAGNDCTVDCSGHEAGYRWAEEKDIQDEEDCEAAGEHSNSPSFAEGCKSYVNGESTTDDDDDQKSDSGDDN